MLSKTKQGRNNGVNIPKIRKEKMLNSNSITKNKKVPKMKIKLVFGFVSVFFFQTYKLKIFIGSTLRGRSPGKRIENQIGVQIYFGMNRSYREHKTVRVFADLVKSPVPHMVPSQSWMTRMAPESRARMKL